MKDNFSLQSDQYAKYRPTYPAELFDFLDSLVINKQNAWDCGTGNGQVAFELAKMFGNVWATDISRSQIDNATKRSNITYTVQPAEHTNFEGNFFDLIVVAQAIHWFDFDKFYEEVKRTARKDAVICVTGYGQISVSPEIDEVISHFYTNVIGSYWDTERNYIDEGYQTIPFPFEEIPVPQISISLKWDFEHLMGYFGTWSAVKHFISDKGFNPVEQLRLQLVPLWQTQQPKEVTFPVLLRIGKVHV
ncbi:MAG: class I SAM-dependent methyltransferase [Bacteroidota bacterium]